MKKLFLTLICALLSSIALAQDPVWIDVRSAEEHAQNHIAGDLLIPHEEIVAQVSTLLPDKNTEIHLYCRSGRRADMALSKLKAAGYHNVFNAGGIDEARAARTLAQESCNPRC